MHQFKVQIWTKDHKFLETIISALNDPQVRLLAQAMFPGSSVGCVRRLD